MVNLIFCFDTKVANWTNLAGDAIIVFALYFKANSRAMLSGLDLKEEADVNKGNWLFFFFFLNSPRSTK